MSIRTAAASLALCVCAAELAAQTTVPGWTYGFNITFDSGTGAANRGSMAMRYRTSANALRMELVQIGGSANRVTGGVDVEGVYTLINDADSTYTTVLPSQHAATVMRNPRYLFEGQALPSVERNTVSQSVEDLGNGGTILGHATHHYRMITRGNMTFTTSGGSCTRSADGESEVWVAPDVDIAPAMRSVVAHYGFTVPDSATHQSSSTPMRGLPLRTRTRTVAVLPTGESRVIETTMEYTELSNAPLDASLFVVPSDYHVMDMRKQMAGMFSGAADAAAARSAATSGLCPR